MYYVLNKEVHLYRHTSTPIIDHLTYSRSNCHSHNYVSLVVRASVHLCFPWAPLSLPGRQFPLLLRTECSCCAPRSSSRDPILISRSSSSINIYTSILSKFSNGPYISSSSSFSMSCTSLSRNYGSLVAWKSVHALNTEGLKAGSVYVLNRKYALNNRVRLTTRVYGTLLENLVKITKSVWGILEKLRYSSARVLDKNTLIVHILFHPCFVKWAFS